MNEYIEALKLLNESADGNPKAKECVDKVRKKFMELVLAYCVNCRSCFENCKGCVFEGIFTVKS